MTKYLAALATILSLNIVSVSNVINDLNIKNSLQVQKEVDQKESEDIIDFDIKWTREYKLPNLLNIIKELNQFHKDINENIQLSKGMRWTFIDENGNIFGSEEVIVSVENLNNLVNSNYVEFKEVKFLIFDRGVNSYKVTLSYEILDIKQTIELFSLKKDNLPIKQDNFKIQFSIPYEF